jgi:hypothetical protein
MSRWLLEVQSVQRIVLVWSLASSVADVRIVGSVSVLMSCPINFKVENMAYGLVNLMAVQLKIKS